MNKRELQEKINNHEYNRLSSETKIKQAILNNIDAFLRQLVIGFTYIGNEYKIKVNDRYNYVDLLLYNYELY